ncbi:unnamed protein product, partial [Rotaria socialis]
LAFNEKDEGMTVEDAFSLTFQVAITDAIGSQLLFDLKDGGYTISVTNANREVIIRIFFFPFHNYHFEFYPLGIRTALQ